MNVKNAITSYEEKIEKLQVEIEEGYKIIGRKYYELHSADAEEGVREDVEKLNELNVDLTYQQEQLENYKNNRICKSCGAEISETDRFCNNCGVRIIRENEVGQDDANACPMCGEPVREGQKFCCKCGWSLLKVEAEAEPEIESEVEVEAEEAKPEKKHVCPGCGNEVEPDMKFCIICGQKLD